MFRDQFRCVFVFLCDTKLLGLPSVDSAVDRTCSALDDGAEVETVEVVVDSVSSVTVGFAASVLEVVRGQE